MDINSVTKELGEAFSAFKAKYDNDLAEVKAQADAIETALAKGQLPGGSREGLRGGGTPNSAAAQEHRTKFLAWARRGGGEDTLRSLEAQASLSTVSDPDGGFLVPAEMDHELGKLAIDSVAMRRLARIVNASGDYKKPLSAGGATGGWVGETESRTETESPELKLFDPPWSELYALPEVTQKLLDMSDFDVAGWLLDELQDVETEMEGAAFISGNGVGRPRGILSYDTVANASWEWGKIGYIVSGAASTLTNADKLISLQHALKPVYRRNGTWLMNDTTLEVIRKFKDGDGNYIWRPGLASGAPDMLLGKPVEVDDNMPDIGAGEYPIAFGDFNRGYTIGDHKVGRRLLRDPFTKKGWVKFYLTKRVFGGVTNHQALKLMKISA